MWLVVGMIFVLYFILFFVYMFGVDVMRYVMVVFCGFGFLIYLFLVGFILMFSFFSDYLFFEVIFVLGVSFVVVVVNVIWFVVVF